MPRERPVTSCEVTLPTSALSTLVPVKSALVFTCNQYFVALSAAPHLKVMVAPGDKSKGASGGDGGAPQPARSRLAVEAVKSVPAELGKVKVE